ERGELSFVNESIDFALWLAARETFADATNWSNYSVLWSARFTLWSKLKVTKNVTQLREEARRKQIDFTRLVGPEATFDSEVKDFKEDIADLKPVLVGPLANAKISETIPTDVYAVVRDPDEKKHVQEEIEKIRKER